MKNKLRLLTSLTIALGAIAAVFLLAEPAIERWRAESQQNEATEADNSLDKNLRRVKAANIAVDPAGDRQLLMAIARLEQRDHVVARIQHEAHIGGLRLDGKGEYLQQGRGTRRHVRWLLESQHEGVRASLLQSTDGSFLWTDRHIATGRHIERIDLWQLRRMSKRMAGDDAGESADPSAPFSPQLSTNFGGLPSLLESLRTHFEFTAPGAFRAPKNLNLGDQPVLGMIGRWRPESLATVLADISDLDHQQLTPAVLADRFEQELVSKSLPTRLPMNVMILLGQHDLFPYLIEYRSSGDPMASVELPPPSLFQLSREPLARLEFFDVEFDREISTVEFIYEPPAEPAWFDGTNSYVDRLERRQAIQIAQQNGRRLANEQDAPLR